MKSSMVGEYGQPRFDSVSRSSVACYRCSIVNRYLAVWKKAHEVGIRTRTMLGFVETKSRLSPSILVVLVVLVATFHRAIAHQFDPPFPCHKSEDCFAHSSTLKNATCKNGFCLCRNETQMKNCSSIEISQQRSRNAATPVFRGCKIDHDCMFKHAVCNTTISQCECQRDYVFSTNKTECLKKATTIDFPCVEDRQCLAFLRNTTCRNGQCSCISGYHYFKDTCYKMIDFGKPCTRSEECAHIEDAVCTERNVCDCRAETVLSASKGKCLQVAREILENCVEDAQCATTFSNALCVDRRCRCRNQYHFEAKMNQCFVDIGLDEKCGNKYECYRIGEENATTKAMNCVENVCVCAEGFEREGDECVINGGARLFGSFLPLLLVVFAASSGQI